MKWLLTIVLFISTIAHAQDGGWWLLSPLAVTQPETQTFDQTVTNAGCTPLTSTQKRALDTLIMDLKGQSNPNYTTGVDFWDRDLAYYPMTGSCLTSMLLNLKNPIDADAAYRLSFAITTSSTTTVVGAGGLNVSGFQNTLLTHINASTLGTSSHLAFYSRTDDPQVNIIAIGAYDGVASPARLDYISTSQGYFTTNAFATFSYTTTAALFIGTVSGTTVKSYRNGVPVGSATGTISRPNLDIGIMGRNNNVNNYAMEFRQCAFASVGAGMTDAEAAIFSTIINEYQKRLSRNVY